MLSKTIVKYIQSLSHKKFRDEYGVFIAEGPKVVGELLASKQVKCKIVCGLGSWMNDHTDLFKKIPAEDQVEITETELERISHLQTPNKVVAVFYKKPEKTITDPGKDTVCLVLDEIQDPGNLGTIIRTADWFGLTNIICSPNCADCYNPKVVQATMGSLARVDVSYTDLPKFISENKDSKIYAAALHGKEVSTYKKIKEGLILIGNESKGVKKELLLFAEKITIPGKGQAESLNAAVATGIILFHLL